MVGAIICPHIPVAEQAQRPVSLVFVFDPDRPPGLHRDRLGDPLQGLNARHLIHGYGVDMLLKIQPRGLQIGLANDLDLLLEDLGIFLFGVEPILAAMWLQFGLNQIPADLANRNGGHYRPMDNFICQFALGPAIDRPSGLIRRLAGHGQNLRDLLGGERTPGTAPRRVAEYVFDCTAKLCLRFTAFDGHQCVIGLLPTPPPEADLFSCQPDVLGNRHIEHATKSH
jgi:hypothetical protein